MHILVLERPVYVRERADGLYTPGTYLLYKVLEEGGIAFATSAILSVAVFFAVAIQASPTCSRTCVSFPPSGENELVGASVRERMKFDLASMSAIVL